MACWEKGERKKKHAKESQNVCLAPLPPPPLHPSFPPFLPPSIISSSTVGGEKEEGGLGGVRRPEQRVLAADQSDADSRCHL